MAQTIFQYLPRGNTLEDHSWRHRHHILVVLLALHVPVLLAFGVVLHSGPVLLAGSLSVPLLCLLMGYLVHARRPASILVTAGLTWCSASLVILTRGAIEAHFHFFIIIGFIALYQDWVPFLWNIVFTVVSHGVGSALPNIKIFDHPAGQANPWVWSAIHGAAVLAACAGLVIFWRVSEEDQEARARLRIEHKVAEAELGRRRFAAELLINLARRNQSMLYRQLEIINQLEEKERDPDALAELFRLDHLATRVRRNAESLLVLSGETPSRVWSAPVALREVLQAAIAETEELTRVRFTVDENLAVAGDTVTDLTHLLAELAENAVHFSPPETHVTIGVRPLFQRPGAHLVIIEDWGIGMPPDVIDETNLLLAHPPEVDLSVASRLGFHVVARLAQRHHLDVSLVPTPGSGITAVVVLPPEIFEAAQADYVGAGANGALRAPSNGTSSANSDVGLNGTSNGTSSRIPLAREVIATPVPFETWDRARTRRPSPRPRTLEGPGEWPPAQVVSHRAAPVATQRIAEESVSTPAQWSTPVRTGGSAEDTGPLAMPEDAPGASADRFGEDRTDTPTLNQRQPQKHLAPELLRPSPRPRARPAPAGGVPDPRPASEALSRFQASRRAAQAETGRAGRTENGDA